MQKTLVNKHVPMGDSYEIQTWNYERQLWQIWGYADTWAEAVAVKDHAARTCDLPKLQTKIVKLYAKTRGCGELDCCVT